MAIKNQLLIIGFIFLFWGCKEDVTITFVDSNFTSKNNKIVQVNIPLISNESNAAKHINTTIKNKVITALHIGEPDNISSKSIEESISNFNLENNNFLKDFPESNQPWEAEIDGEVILQSETIISIALTSYTNTGGAHGNINITFLNFNTETGIEISNSDLFIDEVGFIEIAKNYFDKALENEDAVFNLDTFDLPENIGFNDEGIVLLYNTYEITPYATEIIEFEIPYDEIESFLAFNNF